MFSRFTVLRNVVFGLKLRDDISDAERRRIAHEHLKLVGPENLRCQRARIFPRLKQPERRRRGLEDRAQEAIDLVRETTETLYAERGDTAKLWGRWSRDAETAPAGLSMSHSTDFIIQRAA